MGLWFFNSTQDTENTSHTHAALVYSREHIMSSRRAAEPSLRHLPGLVRAARRRDRSTHSERRVVWVSLRWFRTDSGHFGFISQAKVGQIPSELLFFFYSRPTFPLSLFSLWPPPLFLLTLSPHLYDLFPFFLDSFSSAWDIRPSLAVLIIT